MLPTILAQAETVDRGMRSIRHQTHAVRFPIHSHLSGFDFEQSKAVRSMSRKACSPDNAGCEGFFCRLKNELLYSRNWLSTTIDEFAAALDAYIR